MKKIWKHLFNQNMLYILLMLVQIAFLVLSVLFLNRNYAWVYGALLLLNGLLIIYITNSRKNPTYKNAWLVVIAVLPIFGGLSYLFLKTRRDTRIFFHNYEQQMEQTKPLLVQEPDAARHLFRFTTYPPTCSIRAFRFMNRPMSPISHWAKNNLQR